MLERPWRANRRSRERMPTKPRKDEVCDVLRRAAPLFVSTSAANTPAVVPFLLSPDAKPVTGSGERRGRPQARRLAAPTTVLCRTINSLIVSPVPEDSSPTQCLSERQRNSISHFLAGLDGRPWQFGEVDGTGEAGRWATLTYLAFVDWFMKPNFSVVLTCLAILGGLDARRP